MRSMLVTIVLFIGVVFSSAMLASRVGSLHLPGNQQGYAPVQPIAFSHRLHTGELQIDCLYCHYGVERSRRAGIPAASVCMNCHRFVTAPFAAVRAEDRRAGEENRTPRRVVSPEIQKLYDALALGENLQPDPEASARPIEWVQIHNLPDFVVFDHRAHQAAGVACQRCHGPVETFERAHQVEDLSMGWCVDCHRQVNQIGVGGRSVHASLDCVTCHY